MKHRAFLTLLIFSISFPALHPIAAAVNREAVGLVGTSWDVFVLQFPFCRDACGGATVTFYEAGEGVIEWNNPDSEGLPFSCRLQKMSLSGSLIFTINEGGWGAAQMDTYIIMLLYGAYRDRINYIIMGVPHKCADEGELFSFVFPEYPKHCCMGLTEWHSGFDARIAIGDTCYETGRVKGAPVGTCLHCGNGVCGTQENICNCDKDCAPRINSDFGTIDEFCRSERWAEMVHACEDQPGMEDLPLCALCE